MNERLKFITKILRTIFGKLDLNDQVIKILAREIDFNMPNKILPRKEETVAVSNSPMLAALCFDRVWQPTPKAPNDIIFFANTQTEVTLMTLYHATRLFNSIVKNVDDIDDELQKKIMMGIRILMAVNIKAGSNPFTKEEATQWTMSINDVIFSHFNRRISETTSKVTGINIPVIYTSTAERDQEYLPGRYQVIETSINNLNIIDETSLSWEQVVEFRQDAEARIRYINFVHWLDSQMIGKSSSFITDEISNRLDNYLWAIKKHGLKTITGAISSTIDNKALFSTLLSAGGITALSGDYLSGILGAAGILTAKAALTIAERRIDLEDIKRSGKEISFVYEIHKKFGRNP